MILAKLVIIGAVSLLPSLVVSAQSSVSSHKLKTEAQPITLQTCRPQIGGVTNARLVSFMNMKKTLVPYRQSSKFLSLGQSQKPNMSSLSQRPVAQPIFRTPGNTILYGEIIGSGVASFSSQDPATFNYLLKSADFGNLDANGGGIITRDSIYHCLKNYYDMFLVYQEYNVFSGTMLSSGGPTDMSIISTDLAYDPATDEVYGAFFNSEKSSMELGVMDYSTMTRTNIGTLDQPIIALASSATGQLYGIGINGNLYKISKDHANETLVGATGVTVSTDGTSAFSQSAEIDPSTGTFYWAATNSEGKTALYQVDLNSGSASKLVDYPENTQIIALSFLDEVEPGAPETAYHLKATFKDSCLTGTFSFTLPQKDVSGHALDGMLIYKVTANGVLLKEGTEQPGADVDLTLDVNPGMNNLAVTVGNTYGESKMANIKIWAGMDAPTAVSHLFANLDGKDVSLSWAAPKTGIHGGYVGSLKYDVMRLPDSVEVAVDLADTIFRETLSADNLISYKYVVTPKNDSFRGVPAVSNKVVLGSAFEPPYFQDFNDENTLDLYTILDDNKDGNTWVWNSDRQCLSTSYSDSKGSDDYIITPPMHLSANKVYTFSYRMSGDGEPWPERMNVTMGSELSPYDYSYVIMPDQEVFNQKSKLVRAYINNVEDRNVRFAFHHDTPAGRNYYGRIYVDSVRLESGIDYNAPDSVTSLTVKPGDKGQLSAMVSFKAPTQKISQSPLTSIHEIRVYRSDSILVGKVENPVPGAVLCVEDELGGPKLGKNVYSVVATNEAGDGLINECERFIGVDIPNYPQNAKLIDEGDHYLARWDKPTEEGLNRGYVNPDSVYFTISQVVDSPVGGYAEGNWLVDSIYNTEAVVEDLNTTDDGLAGSVVYQPNEGEQDFLDLALKSTNSLGSAGSIVVRTVKGKPYDLPYRESFRGGELAYDFAWVSYNVTRDNYLQLTTDSASDADGGCIAWKSYDKEEYFDFNTGKIAITEAQKPVLMYSYYATPGKNFSMQVSAVKPDAATQVLKTINFDTLQGVPGWRTEVIDLSDLKDNNWLYFCFHLANGGSETSMALDNINVLDGKDHDLSISVSCPQSANAGDTVRADIIVRNVGLSLESGYSVEVSCDGKVVKDFDGPVLGALGEWHIPYDYPVSINASKVLPISVEVIADRDDDESNNISRDTIVINQPDFDTVTDLSATTDGSDVALTWSAPTRQEAKEVTEDFERYAPWIIDHIGRWTLIDGDGGLTGTFSNMPSFPNVNEPFAFIVMNPGEWGIDTSLNPFIAAHSQEQFLTTFYAYKHGEQGDEYVDADNWLISPKLGGEAQTVKFYVRDLKSGDTDLPEQFEVCYSNEGKNVSEFEKLGDTYSVSGGEWKEIDVSLPSGARYFAIHHITPAGEGYMFEIDDVTYTQAGSPDIVGFNIYCDGEKVGTTGTGQTSFSYSPVDGKSHVYNVTVVYTEGESRYSNDATVATFINEVQLPSRPFNVYSLSGILVRKNATTLDGLQPGVYIVEGQKVTVK